MREDWSQDSWNFSSLSACSVTACQVFLGNWICSTGGLTIGFLLTESYLPTPLIPDIAIGGDG